MQSAVRWIQFRAAVDSLLTPTRVDDFTLTIPYNDDLHPEDWIMDDPDVELPRLLFCDREGHGIVRKLSRLMTALARSHARNIKNFYAYDDATYPGDVA
jgi:hypothetical protein